MFRFLLLLALSFFAMAGAVPAPAAVSPRTAPIRAVVSIPAQKYLLERIAGNAVTVTVLVSPDDDPHTYEPTPSQMRAVAAADCWFTIGVPFEDVWLPRIISAAPQLTEISMIEGIQRLTADGAYDDHAHGGADPHVWLSPLLVQEITDNTAKVLCHILPDQVQFMRSNTQAFMDELKLLDQKIFLRFKDIEPKRRVFLSFHSSWRYFAHRYQLTELCIENQGKEPGPKTLKTVTETAKQLGIQTVFVSQFPRSSARAVAQSLNADFAEVNPLAENLLELYTHMAEKLAESFNRQEP